MKKLAERIKELRIEKGVTQKQIANEIGIAQSAYYYYESGKQEPTASVIVKLADYFNVCTDYLLGRKDYY